MNGYTIWIEIEEFDEKTGVGTWIDTLEAGDFDSKEEAQEFQRALAEISKCLQKLK